MTKKRYQAYIDDDDGMIRKIVRVTSLKTGQRRSRVLRSIVESYAREKLARDIPEIREIVENAKGVPTL